MSGRIVMAGVEIRPTIPTPPDEIQVVMDGHVGLLHLSFFTPDALREIGREWTDALLARAAEQRAEGGL